MAITLPVILDEKPVGTCFVGGVKDGKILFVTTLHHLGTGERFRVGVPPHNGDMSQVQVYPLNYIATIDAEIAYADPIYDLAILIAKDSSIQAPLPKYISTDEKILVGSEVYIIGYPYIGLGSFLETAEKSYVSALGKRLFMDTVGVDEIIISHQTYTGSSGSPIIRSSDGVVCGVVRGCLAPPEVLSIGNIPLGTDSNITYAINASILPTLIKNIFGG